MVTEEIVLGIEHSFLPELVGGFSVTYRQADDYYDALGLYRDDVTDQEVIVTADDYVLDTDVQLDNQGGAGTPGFVSGNCCPTVRPYNGAGLRRCATA